MPLRVSLEVDSGRLFDRLDQYRIELAQRLASLILEQAQELLSTTGPPDPGGHPRTRTGTLVGSLTTLVRTTPHNSRIELRGVAYGRILDRSGFAWSADAINQALDRPIHVAVPLAPYVRSGRGLR